MTPPSRPACCEPCPRCSQRALCALKMTRISSRPHLRHRRISYALSTSQNHRYCHRAQYGFARWVHQGSAQKSAPGASHARTAPAPLAPSFTRCGGRAQSAAGGWSGRWALRSRRRSTARSKWKASPLVASPKQLPCRAAGVVEHRPWVSTRSAHPLATRRLDLWHSDATSRTRRLARTQGGPHSQWTHSRNGKTQAVASLRQWQR